MVSTLPRLQMPLHLPLWCVATLRASRAELRALLGEPHYVEKDPHCTCGGEEDAWAFALPGGGRLLVLLEVESDTAAICSDPPDAEPALRALGVDAMEPRVVLHAEPLTMP